MQMGMNIEDYREYCLSLGDDVEEMFGIGVNVQTVPTNYCGN